MAITWSSPKAFPPVDGTVKVALATSTTGNEVNTAPVTDGLDCRGLTAVVPHIEFAQAARGTIRIAGLLPGDTITVDGTVFTAVGPDAVPPPTNVQFITGTSASAKPDRGDDYCTAANLAALINANAATSPNLFAFVAGDGEALVTIVALADGVAGNARTLATSSGRAVLSGATLAGGVAAGAVVGPGASLAAYLLNPATGRWNRAPDLDMPLTEGVASEALPAIPLRAGTSRMQLVPVAVGAACSVYMDGFAGRIP